MKIAAAIGASVLGLVLGNPTLVSAQHGHDDDHGNSDNKHENKKEKNHGHSSAQQDSGRHEGHGQEERREQRPHEQMRQQGSGHAGEAHEHDQHYAKHDVWQDHRAKHWEHEHRTWHERGGYRGYRIPEDRFRAHFGRAHWFRVRSEPVIVVGGYPRFQYSGFWFSVVDPWPEYWSRTWYETDDVYVDYVNDGYYMYNRRHPGVAIAVNVSF